MSIIDMTKLDKDALPNGLLIEDQTLTLSKKYKQSDAITLKLSQRNQTKFNLVVEESVEAKIVLELIDNDTSDVTYDLNLDLKANSQVKFLIVTEIQSNNATFKRSEEHTSELQSRPHLVCRLLLEKKKIK